MNEKTTPDEPGLPPRQPYASFLGRGLWVGVLSLLVAAFLAWLIIEWLLS